MSNAKDKMRQMIAGQDDRTLVETLLMTELTMNGMVRGSDEWRAHYVVRLAVIEEVESRYDVEASMEAWAADAGDEVTYVEALVAALPLEVSA
jgi:NO-binding membrane sensor protein with MHYT domain